jgi:hypothetical protein
MRRLARSTVFPQTMTLYSHLAERSHRHRWVTARMRATALVVVAGAAALVATSASASSLSGSSHRPASANTTPKLGLLVGVPDRHEPSGKAPPVSDALAGYRMSYVQDFNGRSLPTGWGKFEGQPSGTGSSYWAESHVLVGGGIVRLVTYRDPRFGGRWVSGGICQCKSGSQNVGTKYGVFLVRSRVTGPGPDEDELLWPVANVWPPEVDFNESAFSAHSTSWTVHYGSSTKFVQGTHSFNLKRWHTWGVIWTPTTLIFTIDGVAWGVITNRGEIPHQAMTLDIDQEARCIPVSWSACPVHKVALQIDWVAEFTKD